VNSAGAGHSVTYRGASISPGTTSLRMIMLLERSPNPISRRPDLELSTGQAIAFARTHPAQRQVDMEMECITWAMVGHDNEAVRLCKGTIDIGQMSPQHNLRQSVEACAPLTPLCEFAP
jgi:hypothetical protein